MRAVTDLLNAAGNLCLIILVVLFGARYIQRSAPRAEAAAPSTPENWVTEMGTGISWGPADAPIRVLEFMDMECPACAAWATQLDSVMMDHPDLFRVTMHHRPLTGIHPNAMRAAVAVECADSQGVGQDYMRRLLQVQARFRDQPWLNVAMESRMPDSIAYAACLSRPPESFPRILHGLALAEKHGVVATPTVWVNGLLGLYSQVDLRRMVAEFERVEQREIRPAEFAEPW